MNHVLIATPTVGGSVKALYAATLVKTIIAVKDAGWNVDFATADGGTVSRARNYLAHLLLRKSHFTHLMMIDSDMSFEGQVACRLLRCDKPVVAAAYSKRTMNMAAFAQAARDPELPLTDITALALEYNLQPQLDLQAHKLELIDGMCRVNHVAMGCALIRRDAFQSLIDAGVVRLRPDRFLQKSDLGGCLYDFFGEITLEDGNILSEDYSFCKRWRSVPGNEIWAIVDEPIGHIGDMVYGAPYLKRLLQGKA